MFAVGTIDDTLLAEPEMFIERGRVRTVLDGIRGGTMPRV